MSIFFYYERGIRLVRRFLLGFFLAVTAVILAQQITLAPLWSDYYSERPLSNENKHIVKLIEDFIQTHHPDISTSDLNEITSAIMESGERYRVDPRLIASLIAAESGFRKTAVSRKGARGLTQLMPDKCRDFDWRDIRGNIARGTEYLRKMLDQFDSISVALAAYNAGPTRIARSKDWPRETRYYVRKVTSYYSRLLGVRDG